MWGSREICTLFFLFVPASAPPKIRIATSASDEDLILSVFRSFGAGPLLDLILSVAT